MTNASQTLPPLRHTPVRVLRSLLFSLGLLLSTCVISTLVVLAFALPFTQRYRIAQYWSR